MTSDHVFDNDGPHGAPRWRVELGAFCRVENWVDIEDEWEPEVYSGSAPIRVRGQDLPVDLPAGAALVEVFRSLVPQHRDLLLCDEEELAWLAPKGVPQVLLLDDWHHPDVLHTAPSRCETYAQLARVLVTGIPEVCQPTEAPNTHWTNWPQSGSL